MKLYTKTGDNGTTGLFCAQRVDKDALRVEAYGEVDELNSVLGWAAAACTHRELADILHRLQDRLFELGADLATPRGEGTDTQKVARIGDRQIAEAEYLIDQACDQLEPLRQFILPGGGELAGRLHTARSVCRRAERRCVSLARAEDIGAGAVVYLNRLSDLLFALARRANQLDGIPDVPWTGGDGSA